ncbi:hypothetical protein RSAG8_13098, partial [Rhizoctonia solani AG-8 WAC10335]
MPLLNHLKAWCRGKCLAEMGIPKLVSENGKSVGALGYIDRHDAPLLNHLKAWCRGKCLAEMGIPKLVSENGKSVGALGYIDRHDTPSVEASFER